MKITILITNNYIVRFKFLLVVKNTNSASYEFKYSEKYFLEYFFFITFGLTSLNLYEADLLFFTTNKKLKQIIYL